jgi:hypothetical protein
VVERPLRTGRWNHRPMLHWASDSDKEKLNGHE